ncbi:hemerythrin domain-containing protein [Amycolatopsis umgeniensis]|uniref:Hemerythrin-like domain-containing protein n=1 Tax=Amycolatopsis umgeniensis TaxID=336628 RepID=A0A841B7T2_9PSEU|nr:hemerythrin domain-containing protein [Amycolatopsis umgeniensis]MBB5854940.1 hemerythrin-like domain-containing protein [Amycolatopsis umgeniensis]
METPSSPNGRLTAFGNQLVQVHNWLRKELARLHDDLGSVADGRAERLRDLRAHCLTFCSALTRHHTGEDGGAFLVLAEKFPELRPVLEELAHDHEVMTGIIERLEELVAEVGPGSSQPEILYVQRELDGLTAIMETHFRYEEKRIVEALDSLDMPEWQDSKPAFLLKTH